MIKKLLDDNNQLYKNKKLCSKPDIRVVFAFEINERFGFWGGDITVYVGRTMISFMFPDVRKSFVNRF